MNSGRIAVGDIKMYYQILGGGEPVVMIMGLAGHSLDWGQTLPRRLAKRYQTVLFDNRGAGRSDQASGPLTIKQMADDASGLMGALGIDSAHVFGASMGGMIALQLALDHPQRVRKLLLGATAAGGPSRVFPPPEIENYFTPRPDLSAHDYLLWTAPACYPPEFIAAHPDVVEEKIAANLAHPGTLESYLSQLEAFRSFDVADRLGSIRAETMVLFGSRDALIPPENSLLLAQAIPGTEIREIEGAGHIFWISHPQETAEIVEGFLG
ncbi:MAG TPA: alpha/beta fold hydrolase [Methanothrix sp.]|nr:alpha/beta fold hydrolase [Methanothrix sp.]HPT19159.1 alpha/beta fold hydrolase [Methanothrix sp.]